MSFEFHCEILKAIAREMKPNVYVELGICGGSTFNAVAPFSSEAYAVDIAIGMPKAILQGEKYKPFVMKTEEFAKKWKEDIKKEIDLIFIDADHSKEAVYNDIMNFWPYLKTDSGLMVLHDMWPPSSKYVDPGYCGDGFLVKQKIKKELPDLEFVSLPLQYGLGVMRKAGKDWRNG